jgi:hypothetical protein
MAKFSVLKLKNVSESKLFFAPMNRFIQPNAVVDVLQLSDGDSDLAGRVIERYRKLQGWQVFEVLLGPLPSPEGELDNVTGPKAATDEPAISAPAMKTAKKPKKPHLETPLAEDSEA